MSAALAPYAPSLFTLEQDLEALIETEEFVSPEQEFEFRSELAATLEASIDKRDRVGQFIRHCQLQQANCDEEIQRLQARKRTFCGAEERIRKYVQAVIQSLGTDAKGKPKKLEGRTVTFSLRATPGSVEITDGSLIPAEYKTICLKLPVETWSFICDEFRNDDDDPVWADIKAAESSASVSISKPAIKKTIEGGSDVAGADLTMGGSCLVVK